MRYTFALQESDYLTNYLFIASTSKPSINRRRRGWILVFGSFYLISLFFFLMGDQHQSIAFLMLGTFAFIFYPFYIKWHYKTHYRRHIKEHFTDEFGQKKFIAIEENYLFIEDSDGSEAKFNYSQIESLNNLPEHYLIRLKGGQSLIIPKREIGALAELHTELTQLTTKLNLTLQDHQHWTWK